ncbi:MAG: hypothetical protein ACLFOY_03430 [Desulfatibacillaceae bacterium]
MKGNRAFVASLIATGSSSIAVQLVLVREFMATFGGNELVVGASLGLWLLAGGLGSILASGPARRFRRWRGLLVAGHVVLALLPLVQIAAIRALPGLWVRGQLLGFTPFLVGAAVALVPYALIGGGMLPLAGRLWRGRGVSTPRVYAVDTLGDILGGLLFSLAFVHLLSHWQTAAAFGVLHAAAAAAVLGGRSLVAVAGGGAVAAALLGGLSFEPATRQWRFPEQEILLWKNTPYSQLAITRTGDQYNVYADTVPMFASDDPSVEAMVHPAMCQADTGARVLLVSGGVFGTLEGISAHRPARVDYVELDPAILALDPLLGNSLALPNVHPATGDGRLFIRNTRTTRDVVIVDLPDPESAQLNRFYTREFFTEVKRVLSPDGVLYFNLTGAENYLDPAGLAANRSVYQAAASVFSEVTVFPGPTHYYLAGDRPHNTDIAAVLSAREIESRQLVPYELFGMTDPMRMDMLAKQLAGGDVLPNTDLSPRAFGHLLDLWLARSQSSRVLLYGVAGACLVLALAAWRGGGANAVVLTSGYAAMGLELALVLLFQVVYGYAYVALCVFITLFLAGGAAGAFVYMAREPVPLAVARTCDTGLVLAGVASMLVAWTATGPLSPLVPQLVRFAALPLLVVAAGALAGAQFAAVAGMCTGDESTTTGRLYWADLAGAACGTLFAGLVILPFWGITGVLASVVAVKIADRWMNPAFRPSPA